MTLEELWKPIFLKGYITQFEGDLKTLHDDGRKLIGRAVTATYVPTRPDLHEVMFGVGAEEGRKGNYNQWVIDSLVEGDVVVVDMYDKIYKGTFLGGNLTTAIKTRTKTGGGVIWGGSADKYVVSGDVEIHDNVAGELGNVFRMNHYLWPSLTITGGRIYDNDAESGQAAIYAINNPVSLTGGYIDDDILFTGNDYLTIGAVELLGTVRCSIGLNVNQVNLAADFNGFKFTADEAANNFAAFNLKPAEGYVYTEGDEAKLVCLNENYETYWDAATESFRLQAKN